MDISWNSTAYCFYIFLDYDSGCIQFRGWYQICCWPNKNRDLHAEDDKPMVLTVRFFQTHSIGGNHQSSSIFVSGDELGSFSAKSLYFFAGQRSTFIDSSYFFFPEMSDCLRANARFLSVLFPIFASKSPFCRSESTLQCCVWSRSLYNIYIYMIHIYMYIYK